MQFRSIIFALLCVVCLNATSAQQLTPKKQRKFAEKVNLTALVGETMCDKSYVHNVDWLEYQWWLEKTYGKESEQYKSSILDMSAAHALMPDSIAVVYAHHPQFRTRPVLGVSPEQAAAYCRWRTDRVAESMLVQQLKVRTFQFTTSTNIFTLDSYIAPEGVQFLRFSFPHREAVETIARVHVGGNKETEKLDTRYGFYCFAVWK